MNHCAIYQHGLLDLAVALFIAALIGAIIVYIFEIRERMQ